MLFGRFMTGYFSYCQTRLVVCLALAAFPHTTPTSVAAVQSMDEFHWNLAPKELIAPLGSAVNAGTSGFA